MPEQSWSWSNSPRSRVGKTCPQCDRIHSAGDVVAVGKFDPAGIHGYRMRNGGPLRPTRELAAADLCATRATTPPAETDHLPTTTHAEDTEATTKETDRG